LKLTSLYTIGQSDNYEDCLDPSCRVDKHLVFDFPMGVLEVKQAFTSYQEMERLRLPVWVEDMRASGLVIEVEKFSKYLTGIAIMHVDVLDEIPSWLKSVKMFLDIEVARAGKDLFLADSRNYGYLKFEEDLSDVPLPTRIEPRTFMANERTMLKWSRMSFLALSVGLALVGFKHEPISGSILAFFGLLLLCRCYYMYNIRLKLIKNGDVHGDWSDDISSHVLMGMLIVPATIYFTRQVYQVF